jgi:hypothetical protein
VTLSRSNPRAKPRWALLVTTIAASLVLLATAALAVVTDGTTSDQCDLFVPSSASSDICTTDAGAIVEYIGSSASNQSSGTGIFDPFVRLQGSPTEKGYNTNGTLQYETKAGKWTHAILVNSIPIVDCDGTGGGTALCWELFVDINESNTAKQISLNEMEIWYTSNELLTGYPFTGTDATKQYDFSGEILINDVNQGSGRGDLRYLVPLTSIPTPPAGTYFLLYSEWGGTSAGAQYVSDGGFEEWKVRRVQINSIGTQLMNTNGADPDTAIADGGTVPIGTVVYDTATLSNATSDAGGTVSYFYKAQTGTTPDCTGGTQVGSAVTVTNGVVPASATVALNAAGTYEFWAVYSGDAATENNPSTSPCGSETVVVGKNSPAPHSTPVVQIKDTLTVSGLTADATGNVLVGLYTSSDCTTGQIGSNTSFAASLFVGGGTQETSFVAVTAGTYYYKISYAGDANNEPFSSCAEIVGVSITSVP